MGGALKSVGGVVNGIMSPLGLGGEQGQYAQANNYNPALNQLNEQQGLYQAHPQLMNNVQAYGNGSMSLDDAIHGGTSMSGPAQQAYLNDLSTNPFTGSKFATDQVQSNPMLGQLFGKGGTLDRTNSEEQRLSSQGFQLTPEDREAYGQASGDIARLFGSQEQGLSQSLADRGLASAPSGAAGVGFSGLQGNKNEMLAKAQTNIANQRMQNTMQRLGQTRSFLSQLGSQGASAIQDQYGRQLSGAQDQSNNLARAAGLNIQQNSAANKDNMASMQDQRGAAGKTLFGALGNGLYSGVSSAAGGAVAGSAPGSGASPSNAPPGGITNAQQTGAPGLMGRGQSASGLLMA